jgi:hypothetical protein
MSWYALQFGRTWFEWYGSFAVPDPRSVTYVWHVPWTQALFAPHALKHAPQLFTSVCMSAQYEEPPSGVQSVWVPPSAPAQPLLHAPLTQTFPLPQALKHVPQLALSVVVFAQYGAPPSGWQRTSAPPSPPHELLHCPPLQTSPAPHTFPQEPQLALSACVCAQ